MSTAPGIERAADLHARDGHLTPLTMDRFECGELETALHEVVVEHLDTCTLCADRFHTMQRDRARIEPPGLRTAEAHGSSSAHWLAAAAGLAMAAGLLLFVWPHPEQASLLPVAEPTLSASPYTTSAATEHGSTPHFELRLLVGEAGHPLASGDAVPTDEPLQVEVRLSTSGWLALLVDSDRTGATPDEGADDTGGFAPDSSATVLLEPRAVDPSDSPLRVVHELDAEGAVQHRVIAIVCLEPFSIDPLDVAGFDAIELVGLPEGCSTQAVHYLPWGGFASS